MRQKPSAALIVVDVQIDFLPGGALAVPDGDAVVPLINRISRDFDTVVLTQDWHPAGHISFASSHKGRQTFELIELAYGRQVLWPDHCIQGSPGAALAPSLDIPHAQAIVRKGFHPQVDSYSSFREADRTTPTGLAGYLRERGIGEVVVAGLATDFCVGWTATDARALGFETLVAMDACRAIDANGSLAGAIRAMDEAGVGMIESSNL